MAAVVASLGVVFALSRAGLTLVLLRTIVGTGVGLGLVAWSTVVVVVLVAPAALLISLLDGCSAGPRAQARPTGQSRLGAIDQVDRLRSAQPDRGAMFWLKRNMLLGSYFVFSATSRSKRALPYAAVTSLAVASSPR